ncbi:MAG: HAD family hydrolase [Acidobacteria bacterium]|nr:MAG: HAD family hydrolase [Acidobacteriota bacterium]
MMNDQHPIDPQVIARLPASAGRQLLRYALEQPAPRESRRIFVNRTLRMESIRYVGFDLDWTLAAYHQDALSQLAFELTLERLVERHDYPREVLKAEYRADFTRRGLIVDTEAGTVLKMNRHRYVGRAYLGRHFLDGAERARLYRREPINPASARFSIVDTLFELPEVNIFAELVEASRRRPRLTLPSYARLAKDIRTAIDSVHADGTLKRRVLADLGRYLPVDPELALALRRLALGGRKLMLITNSEWFYTDALCRHLFDGVLPGLSSWRTIFDLVVVDARKPGFFRRQRPFVALDERGQPREEVALPAWGGLYSGGSREGLMQLIDGQGEEVLYVGDHIYGDILSTKLASTWRTCLVVSELEEELETLRGLSAQLRVMEALRTELADLGGRMDDLRDVLTLYRELTDDGSESAAADPAVVKTQALIDDLHAEHRGLRQHTRRVQRRISVALNPYWGSLFKQGSNKSFFGAQVDDFACVYTSRVSNFAAYGSNHYFRVLRDAMMHDWVV